MAMLPGQPKRRPSQVPAPGSVSSSTTLSPVSTQMPNGSTNFGWGSQTAGMTSGTTSTGGGLPTGTDRRVNSLGLKGKDFTSLAGAAGVTSGTAAPAAATGPQAELDKLRQDIMDSHKNSWSGIQSGINAQGALNARRMAEVNATMGRNVGGAFWGGQVQAQLGTQQNMLNAGLEHERQGRNLQMEHLEQQIRQNEREEDRAFQLALTEKGVPNTDKPSASGGADGITGSWEGHAGRSVTSGYISRHFNRQATEALGRPLSPAEQAQVDSYIKDYYRRTGKYPSSETIAANAGGGILYQQMQGNTRKKYGS